MAKNTPIIHQMVAAGVACGAPPYHFKTNPPPEPYDGTGGYDMGNTTHDGYGSDGTKIIATPVTCPECIKIPVKISRGAGSPMVPVFPKAG